MSDAADSSISLLLFTVGGVRFGCDADRTAGVAAGCGEGDDEPLRFHEELGCGAWQVSYEAPAVVTVDTGKPRPYRVVIDAMDEIGDFSRHDIRLLPPHVEPFALKRGIWGVLPHQGKLVLLVDFLLLLKNKTAHSGEPYEEIS